MTWDLTVWDLMCCMGIGALILFWAMYSTIRAGYDLPCPTLDQLSREVVSLQIDLSGKRPVELHFAARDAHRMTAASVAILRQVLEAISKEHPQLMDRRGCIEDAQTLLRRLS